MSLICVCIFLWLGIVTSVYGGIGDEEKGLEKRLTSCDERKAQPISGDEDDGYTCAADYDDKPCFYFSDFNQFEWERKERKGYTQCVSECPTNFVSIFMWSNYGTSTRYFCRREVCHKRVPFNNSCSLPGDNDHCILQAEGTSSRCVFSPFHKNDCTNITIDLWKAYPCEDGCFYNIYQNTCSAVCDGCVRDGRCVPNTVFNDNCSKIVANFSDVRPCGIDSHCYYDNCVDRCVTCEGWGVGGSKEMSCETIISQVYEYWESRFPTIKVADYGTCRSRTPDFSKNYEWPCGDGDCMYDPVIRECIDICDLRWNEDEGGEDGVCVPQKRICDLMTGCYYDPDNKMCSESCTGGSLDDELRSFGIAKVADLYGCGDIEADFKDKKQPCGTENGHCYYNFRLGKCMSCGGGDEWQVNKICESAVMDTAYMDDS